MREIKFRGLQFGGKWIYGNLVICGNGDYQIGSCSEYGYPYYRIKVYPDSVGQYTGLKDKNGVEIYEGDIVEFKDSTGLHHEEVKFDKGCFYAGEHWGSSTRNAPKLINTRIAKVIGNIYENKELLECN